MEISISSYEDSIISTRSENISSIIDKLVRLAAKLTERFASDIIYDIKTLNYAIKLNKRYDRILFFRESGVTAWETEKLDAEAYEVIKFNCSPIYQVWRLTYDPSRTETKLERVHIYKEFSLKVQMT